MSKSEITGDEMVEIARDARLERERWAAREPVRERRRYALLQAAAIHKWANPQDAVNWAEALLTEIESREVK